jgi:hypothetical protein
MARFNEILVGRYNRMAQKLLSMKGSAALVTLSDELFPCLTLFYGAENRYLESWDRFGIQFQQSGTVGNNSAARFRNPTGSNMIAVVEKIVWMTAVLDTLIVRIGPVGTDLTSVQGAQRLDARGRAASTLIASQASPGAAFGFTFLASNPGSGIANSGTDLIYDENQEIPILPGDALQLETNSLNVTLRVSVMWRERALEESELK